MILYSDITTSLGMFFNNSIIAILCSITLNSLQLATAVSSLLKFFSIVNHKLPIVRTSWNYSSMSFVSCFTVMIVINMDRTLAVCKVRKYPYLSGNERNFLSAQFPRDSFVARGVYFSRIRVSGKKTFLQRAQYFPTRPLTAVFNNAD